MHDQIGMLIRSTFLGLFISLSLSFEKFSIQFNLLLCDRLGTIKIHFDRLPWLRIAPRVNMIGDSKCSQSDRPGSLEKQMEMK